MRRYCHFRVDFFHNESLIQGPHSSCVLSMHPRSHWYTSRSKKSTSVGLGSIKLKNFKYPKIFVKHSLQTQAKSHIIKILDRKSVATKIHVIHLLFIAEQYAVPSYTSKTDYGCWWIIFPVEPVDDQKFGIKPRLMQFMVSPKNKCEVLPEASWQFCVFLHVNTYT